MFDSKIKTMFTLSINQLGKRIMSKITFGTAIHIQTRKQIIYEDLADKNLHL